MIRLGGHGLPLGSDDPRAFARAHADFGYGAAYCPPVSINDTARLAAIEKAFAAANVMTPRQYWNSGALIRECFEKLGPWIVSCHAKDIVLRHQAALHFDEIIPGKGQLDYRTYLRELDRLPADVPLMLEHLSDADYAVARDHIFRVGDEIGVGFAGRER